MVLDATKNFAIVTVSTGYDADDTEIVLSTGHGAKLPDPSTDGEFNLIWFNSTDYTPSSDPNVEIVRCTARSSDTLTVTRNQESSGASTKNTADKVYLMILGITAKTILDIDTFLMPRVVSITSSATPTVDTDIYNRVDITALATDITNMSTNLSGSPVNFQSLIYRIKDNGSARTITWGTSFVEHGIALPETTVDSKLLTVGLIYDSTLSKWGCVAVANEE
jgi:hypothetical protein